ncbi:MAG: hypothetical protein GX565_13680 [Lentisphaerae bacterium]|nr:hypothetical protein [Lentisphaerota bacterium]
MEKKCFIVFGTVWLTVCGQSEGANLHWKGPGGDFEEMSSWVENNKVPASEDFIIVKNYSGGDWSVSFNRDETSLKAELGTPRTDRETVFKLNSHTWTLAQDIHMGELTSGGGGIVFTNGVLRAPAFTFVASVTNDLLLGMKDVACETGAMEFRSTRAAFEGGSLTVTNQFLVGKSSGYSAMVSFDKGVVVTATNAFFIGDAASSTGELINVDGQINYQGPSLFCVGRSGHGSMTIAGGKTYINYIPYVGYTNTGVGVLTVTGGTNTFGTGNENKLTVGLIGRGTVLGYGGKNNAVGLTLGSARGSYGEMILTNGTWALSGYSWIGWGGKGVISMSGGTLYSGSIFCIGRISGGTGVVTVAGGTLEVNEEVRLGGDANSAGYLTLSGNGVFKANYISEKSAGAGSAILFDGGTLQPRKALSSGALIRSVDDIRLTARGMVVDTVGFDAVITGVLQNATGEAGGITKKGAGTLTLVGTREATGPVSVLAGTLAMSNTATVSAGTSRIDGTLLLASVGDRLVVGPGAALAGTGTVARVTLQDNALFARAKADHAVTPLSISDCEAIGRMTIALTGYTLDELKTGTLPLIRMPTEAIGTGQVSVTLDGQANQGLIPKYVSDGGQKILSVVYLKGTLILMR